MKKSRFSLLRSICGPDSLLVKEKHAAVQGNL